MVRVETGGGLWRNDIGQENLGHVIRELNAFEIVWGHVHEQGSLDEARMHVEAAARLNPCDASVATVQAVVAI